MKRPTVTPNVTRQPRGDAPAPTVLTRRGALAAVTLPAAALAASCSSLGHERGFTDMLEDYPEKWTGNTEGYILDADGVLTCHPDRGHGNLYTREQFADFIWRFEFLLTPGANNGLGIRAPLEGDAAYLGMELQIIDNRAEQYSELKPWQYHGSIYGVAAAMRGRQNPPGEWNAQEVVAEGTRIVVRLNGSEIVNHDIAPDILNGTVDGREHPGLRRESGHIGFLGHGSVVSFRNIRVKRLV